ncbi:MAG: HAMP domain-containing histidine kinase [Oscillospiraceae bacterium]|nr:HAMP domain-containing histidine kinase [Oscillospiraceae bacterium]
MSWGTAAAAIFAAAALAAAVWNRLHAKRVMKDLERMLDAAMAGTFLEQDFDESLLSAVESRFAHYLAANAVSAQKLQEEKDKIKTLIADISHQTKTPVANILLYAQLLSEQELSPQGRNCAAALEGQVEKLRALIEALVKTSRLEAGVLALHPRAGPLGPVLEEAAAQLAPKAAERRIRLVLSPTDISAVFDPKWTGEALCNLLDNAVKYTPAGGRVAVEAVSYQLFCRIDVTDTGPGIPEEELSKVFQRFYRSPAAYEAEGVGIGLYLARQIAQGQGGYIKASSRPGQGSRFSLYLPRG